MRYQDIRYYRPPPLQRRARRNSRRRRSLDSRSRLTELLSITLSPNDAARQRASYYGWVGFNVLASQEAFRSHLADSDPAIETVDLKQHTMTSDRFRDVALDEPLKRTCRQLLRGTPRIQPSLKAIYVEWPVRTPYRLAANGRDACSFFSERDFESDCLSVTRTRPELTFSFRGASVFACPRGRGALRSQLLKNSLRCSAP